MTKPSPTKCWEGGKSLLNYDDLHLNYKLLDFETKDYHILSFEPNKAL